jgi:hypothetical protein
MCSTGIALKKPQDQGKLARLHGRVAAGVLLFQDVATLPFLVVIDSGSATGSIEFLPALRQLVVAALNFGGTLWLGRPVLRFVLGWISKRKSVDLFLLAALLLALGTAYVAQRVGAAPAVGAFLAGVAVGESDLRHRGRCTTSTLPRHAARLVFCYGWHASRTANDGLCSAAGRPLARTVRPRKTRHGAARHANTSLWHGGFGSSGDRTRPCERAHTTDSHASHECSATARSPSASDVGRGCAVDGLCARDHATQPALAVRILHLRAPRPAIAPR